jgi:hypothetical protein
VEGVMGLRVGEVGGVTLDRARPGRHGG